MAKTLFRIFGSRIRSGLLGWFFTHTDESYFVRQLGTILNEDSTNLSRELTSLEKAGILISTRQGNLKYFQVNKNCAFFSELKGLILKTIGIAGELRAALETVRYDIEYAFIYGSFAKGEETADSDVDLIIIGHVDLDRLDPLIDSLEKKLGRSINYILYSMREFKKKRKAKDGFIIDVLRDKKIMLAGDGRVLKKS